MRQSRLLVLTTSVALVAATPIQSKPMSIDIGDLLVSLPYPEQYVEVCSVDDELAALWKASIPPQNELLACFLTTTDYEEYRNGVDGLFSPYWTFQVMSPTKERAISRAEFAQYVSGLEKLVGGQLDSFWDSHKAEFEAGREGAAEALSQHLGERVDLEWQQPVPVEAVRMSQDLFMSIWMGRLTINAAGREVPSLQVQTSAVMYIKGRVFVLFGYREYKDIADTTALTDLTRRLAFDILALNAPR